MTLSLNDRRFVNSIPRIREAILLHRKDQVHISRWRMYDIYITFIYVVKNKVTLEVIIDSDRNDIMDNIPKRYYLVPSIITNSIFLRFFIRRYLFKALKNIDDSYKYKRPILEITDRDINTVCFYIKYGYSRSVFRYIETDRDVCFEYDKTSKSLIRIKDKYMRFPFETPVAAPATIVRMLRMVDNLLEDISPDYDYTRIDHAYLRVVNFDHFFDNR